MEGTISSRWSISKWAIEERSLDSNHRAVFRDSGLGQLHSDTSSYVSLLGGFQQHTLLGIQCNFPRSRDGLVQSSRIPITLFPSSFPLPFSFSFSFPSFLSPSSSPFFLLSAPWHSVTRLLAVAWMTLSGLPGYHEREDVSVTFGAAPFLLAPARAGPAAWVSTPGLWKP